MPRLSERAKAVLRSRLQLEQAGAALAAEAVDGSSPSFEAALAAFDRARVRWSQAVLDFLLGDLDVADELGRVGRVSAWYERRLGRRERRGVIA